MESERIHLFSICGRGRHAVSALLPVPVSTRTCPIVVPSRLILSFIFVPYDQITSHEMLFGNLEMSRPASVPFTSVIPPRAERKGDGVDEGFFGAMSTKVLPRNAVS